MRTCLTTLSLLTIVSCCWSQQPKNLITNPGFEETADGEAVGWVTSVPNGAPEYALQPTPDGNVARITANTVDDHGRWYQAGIPVVEGINVYRLSARIRTDLDGCAARVTPVYHTDGEWHGANYEAIVVEGETDWQRYVTLIQPPAGTTHIDVQLRVNFLTIGTGTARFDDITLEPVPDMARVPPITYLPGREITLPERIEDAALLTFPRAPENIAMPGYVPSAAEVSDSTLDAFAAPGQRLNLSFCIRALRDLEHLTFEASHLAAGEAQIPAGAITVRRAIVLERMIHSSLPETIEVPTVLEPVASQNIPADTTAWYWVTVQVPDDAAPGEYSGKLWIELEAGRYADVPLRLEILPIDLREPDVALGFYYLMRACEGQPQRIAAHFREMRQRGMTSIGIVAALHLENRDGAPRVVWDEANELGVGMDAWTAEGFARPVIWLMSRVHRFCLDEFGPLESDEFAAAYTAIIEQVQARASEQGWPELIYQPVDEPVGHENRMAVALRCLPLLQQAGVRTEEDGNLRPGDADFEAMYPFVDLINCNFRRHVEQQKLGIWESEMVRRCREDGKLLWTYNIDLTGYHPEVMRFGMGFGREACHSGGMIEWVWQTPRDDPYTVDPERRRQNMTYWYAPVGDHPGGASTGLEGAAEGAIDAAWLATFNAAVANARASDDADRRALAERAVAQYEAQLGRIHFTDLRTAPAVQGEWTVPRRVSEDGRMMVGGEYRMPNGWDFADYDATRRLLADWILRLRE